MQAGSSVIASPCCSINLVNYVNENYQANDRIVVSDLFWYFGYVYYNKTGSVPLLYTPPQANGASGRPGNYGFGTLVNNEADKIYLDSLEKLPVGQTRVWLVSNSAPPDDFAPIPNNWNKVSTLKVGDTQVRLYTLGGSRRLGGARGCSRRHTKPGA